MKSWPNVASKQLQSRKKVQQKYRDIACKANFFHPYLRPATKIYVATSHSVVRQETIQISEQITAFVWFFAQEVDWCMKDCDKQRLQTTVSINLWKILAGHTGDWFDVKTPSICTTELWDALKSFILTSLKFKVAPYPIIVSLDTLKGTLRRDQKVIFVKSPISSPIVMPWAYLTWERGVKVGLIQRRTIRTFLLARLALPVLAVRTRRLSAIEVQDAVRCWETKA